MTEDEWRDIEETVAVHDPDRHVATFFAPARARRHLMALYAFDREVAHVGEVVREPMAGHVRLAWWREQIAAIYEGGKPASPTSRALAESVRAHALPRPLIEAVIDGHAHDLDEAPFADEAALEEHADATTGNVMRLAARIMGLGDRVDKAACHAAVANAYTGHIRDLASFAKLRRCRMPLTWLTEENLNPEDIFAATATTPALQRLTVRAAARTKAALAAANAARFPPSAMPVLSPATLARLKVDPFAPKPLPPWQRVARLALANLMWRL
jgi:phytoene/squalene synthetase